MLIKMMDRHYFICEYGKDCSNTQEYDGREIEEKVKEHNLPPLFPSLRKKTK